MSARFELRTLGLDYGLHEASLDLDGPGLTAVVGPNGAGKSTLLGAMAGLRSPYRGSCMYGGREVRRWTRRDFARRVSFVPQSVRLEFPFTAEQVVYMGRTPFAGGWYESAEDHAAVERAIRTADVADFRARDFRSLSGGERQRVILASAIAQTPETLLLDEPTTFLDLRHQLSIYRLLRDLAREALVVAATHDLSLALAYADRVVVLAHGSVAADGPPAEVLTPARLREVFEVEARLERDARGRPWIAYEN